MPMINEEITRHPAEYRRERLKEERDRLERRLTWAVKRKEARQVERLTRQLAEIDRQLERPPEDLEGRGRATSLRRQYGSEMCDALGWH